MLPRMPGVVLPVPGLCSRSALGADPNQVIDADNWTVLLEAAEEGFLEVAKVLLACGASPRQGRSDDKVRGSALLALLGYSRWSWAWRGPVMDLITGRAPPPRCRVGGSRDRREPNLRY